MACIPRAHRINKKWRSEDVRLQEAASFTSLLLTEPVLAGLAKSGFKTPSPIQLEAIPVGRFGKDLVVQAKSGTGKTLVFTIVALEMLLEVKHPQVLILAPTREIAFQICSVIKAVGCEFDELKCCSFIGGTSITEDKNHAHSCQIAVGTPGRIKQLINLGILKTNSIRLFVLDEADQLLEESFRNDVDDIFLTLPKDKQVIATSATYPKKLKKLVNRYFRKPYLARLSANELALLGIIHYTYLVDSSDMAVLAYKQKLRCLEMVLTTVEFSQCLVFCNMVSKVQQLSSDIKRWGFSTVCISSAKEQSERLKAIDALKRFKCKVLVSSDLTARGIDAENVDLVINFDVPIYTDVYLHRSGRAGRYGSKGVAITFVNEKELKAFKAVETGGNFKSYHLPDPIPENLINIRPQEFFEKTVIEQIASDSTEEQMAAKNMQNESGQSDIDETDDDEETLESNELQTSVDGVLKNSLNGNIDTNDSTNLCLSSNFEVKQAENKQAEIPSVNNTDTELSGSSTESATSQSYLVECKKSKNKLENSSSEVAKPTVSEDKAKEESVINGSVTKMEEKKQKKLKPKVKIVDECKTINDLDESSKNNVLEANSDKCIDKTKRVLPPQVSNFLSTVDPGHRHVFSVFTDIWCELLKNQNGILPKAGDSKKLFEANPDGAGFNEAIESLPPNVSNIQSMSDPDNETRENLPPSVLNIQSMNDQDNKYITDMCSTLSNFIFHQKKNKDSTSECSESNICPKDVSTNCVKSSDGSSTKQKSVSSEDIARFRDGLNDYYLTIFKNYTSEYMPNSPEANDLEKEDETEANVIEKEDEIEANDLKTVDETENSILLIEKEGTHANSENQPQNNSVDEVDSMEDTESSSEIESYLGSTHKHSNREVIFAANSTGESSTDSSSSNCEPLSSVLVQKKKVSQSTIQSESSSEEESFLESTPKKNKGEVIYTSKSTDASTDSSSSSDREAPSSVLLLKQKFNEMVQESYKKQPPRNGFMPKLSKNACRKITQSTAEDVPQGAVFISSSESSTSQTSREASSESSSDIDSYEIQRPKQRRGQNTSSAYSMSSNASRDSSKPKQVRRSSKSQSSQKSSYKGSCNLTQNNEAYNSFQHHDINGVSRSNYGIYNTGHKSSYHESYNLTQNNEEYNNFKHHDVNGVSRSNHGIYNSGHEYYPSTNTVEGNCLCCRSQYANQLPYNYDINYISRSNPQVYNAGLGNFQCSNSMGINSHCSRSHYANQQPYMCTYPSPNQCYIPHASNGYQPHLYNQWYETFQRQLQCIHNSSYFQ